MADFSDSLEKIVLGTARGIVLSPQERERTAFHESGHALLGMLTTGAENDMERASADRPADGGPVGLVTGHRPVSVLPSSSQESPADGVVPATRELVDTETRGSSRNATSRPWPPCAAAATGSTSWTAPSWTAKPWKKTKRTPRPASTPAPPTPRSPAAKRQAPPRRPAHPRDGPDHVTSTSSR
jgi:hypothetical protein